MILAVTGWRHYTDGAFIRGNLMVCNGLRICSYYGPLHVRVGDADGADKIVRQWCLDNGISHHVFVAQRYPSGALLPGEGPARNRRMLLGIGDHVTGPTGLLMAFPRTDGVRSTSPGSGTFGCAIEATLQGIKVEIPAYKRSGD